MKAIKDGYIICPSILSADYTKLGQEISDVLDGGADWVHIDVMDGHFVPNITIGPLITKAARQAAPDAFLDVHLMISDPDTYASEFADAGADLIVVHVESTHHLNRTIAHIHDLGCHAGVVLNPSTPLSLLEWVLDDVELVMLMSVNPGFGGQKFIPSSLDKIRKLKEMIDARGLSTVIEVDGGVGVKNIGEVAKAGARAFVAGSAIYGTEDYKVTIDAMRAELAKV